jgi:hypothetical protein
MKTVIIALILSLVSNSCLAKESDETIKRANAAYAVAFTRATDAIEACEKNRKTEPSSKLKGLNIKPEHLKIILKYHSARASYACASKEIKEFLLASSIAKSIAGFEPEQAGAALLTYSAQTAFKLKTEYLQIPEEIRASVESLGDFQHPFDMIAYAQALSLK